MARIDASAAPDIECGKSAEQCGDFYASSRTGTATATYRRSSPPFYRGTAAVRCCEQ
jgi:hypothetical protein